MFMIGAEGTRTGRMRAQIRPLARPIHRSTPRPISYPLSEATHQAPETVAPRPLTIDQRILNAVSRKSMLDLHELTLSIWPDLEEKPREVALSAIFYLRHRVDRLVAAGSLCVEGGKIQPRG